MWGATRAVNSLGRLRIRMSEQAGCVEARAHGPTTDAVPGRARSVKVKHARAFLSSSVVHGLNRRVQHHMNLRMRESCLVGAGLRTWYSVEERACPRYLRAIPPEAEYDVVVGTARAQTVMQICAADLPSSTLVSAYRV